jgi:glutathione S-transferase
MKLYHAPFTRGFRPRWLLEEAGASYELIPLSVRNRDHKSEDYLRIHPLGSIPALVDGDQSIFDSTAICLHIADKVGNGLAPALESPSRGAYYQWILFTMTSIEPKVEPVYLRGFGHPSETRHETATDEERAKLAGVLAPIQKQLASHPFILGEAFSAADVILGGVLDWADRVGLLRDAEDLQAYLGRLRKREAFVRALAS